jgi:hypothetical protein
MAIHGAQTLQLLPTLQWLLPKIAQKATRSRTHTSGRIRKALEDPLEQWPLFKVIHSSSKLQRLRMDGMAPNMHGEHAGQSKAAMHSGACKDSKSKPMSEAKPHPLRSTCELGPRSYIKIRQMSYVLFRE